MTFSSVGYGEVSGDTREEFMVAMFTEMVGICFFGYIIGLLQTIFLMMGNQDQAAE